MGIAMAITSGHMMAIMLGVLRVMKYMVQMVVTWVR